MPFHAVRRLITRCLWDSLKISRHITHQCASDRESNPGRQLCQPTQCYIAAGITVPDLRVSGKKRKMRQPVELLQRCQGSECLTTWAVMRRNAQNKPEPSTSHLVASASCVFAAHCLKRIPHLKPKDRLPHVRLCFSYRDRYPANWKAPVPPIDSVPREAFHRLLHKFYSPSGLYLRPLPLDNFCSALPPSNQSHQLTFESFASLQTSTSYRLKPQTCLTIGILSPRSEAAPAAAVLASGKPSSVERPPSTLPSAAAVSSAPRRSTRLPTL